MAKKKTKLPKEFDDLLEKGDIQALKEVFDHCALDARGGYNKHTALGYDHLPEAFIRWFVEQGGDINSRDCYEQTPLYNHASSWHGNVKLLLELGAHIEALDKKSHTPLHAAANRYHVENVKVLLEHGANHLAENKDGRTPLAAALYNCTNSKIIEMAVIAEDLLQAGTPVNEDMKDAVKAIGESLEFYRDRFNNEHIDETDKALGQLYVLFGVEPVVALNKHDGESPIDVKTTRWQDQHEELWNFLVPGSGPAMTIQGEVIRITGRVSREVLDNGGINWDEDYQMMLDALATYFTKGKALSPELSKESSILIQKVYKGRGHKEPARLAELAVKWVLDNAEPIPLGEMAYTR